MEPEEKTSPDLIFSPEEERAVGIEEYVIEGRQIPAITKSLLSDFIVNEIDTQGNVVYVENKPLSIKSSMDKKKADYTVTKELLEATSKNLSEEVALEVEKLYQKLEAGEKIEWQFVMSDIPAEKSERLRMHTFVRQRLENIESNTLEGNRIRLKFNKKLRKMDPAARKKYIHFKLFKSNIDTMSALFKLSKVTGISHKVFSSAGLKDKRGITTQMISVFNSDVNSLKKFYHLAERNRQIWIDGIVENQEDAIAMGCLQGNQFGLVLRLLNPDDIDEIERRVLAIRKNGIINYFGMQRFGSCGTKTHLVGKMILKKDWEAIVRSLILEDSGNFGVNQIKRQLFENKEYSKAEKALSSKYKIEKSLFNGLHKYGENYRNVFQNLPRTMRTLYCHALQSYLWNKIVSRRIREHGIKVVVGDIVGVLKSQNEVKQQKDPEALNSARNIEEEEENNPVFIQGDEAAVESEEVEAVLVTEQNIGKYTIWDLVAPLYGPTLNMPEKSLLEEYLLQEMSQLQICKQDFETKSKSLCFQGAYRKILIQADNVTFEACRHKDKRSELLSPFYMNGEKVEYLSGELVSAVIVLQLPKSSYATIAIRQLLHIPSSFKVQMQLNKEYEKI